MPSGAFLDIMDAWNEMASTCEAHTCRHLNEERCRKLAARLKDDFWKENWREGLEMVPDSPFLNGDNDRGWLANFDWFIRPTTLTKLTEGQYDGRHRPDDNGRQEALRRAYPNS